MSKKNPKAAFYQLLDLLPKISAQATDICLLGGTGDGWPARLAFDPSSKLSLTGSAANSKALVDFATTNYGKLIIGFISYDFGRDLHGIRRVKPSDINLPDIYFLAYDNYLQIADGQIENHGQKIILDQKSTEPNLHFLDQKFQPTISQIKYNQLFKQTKNHIKAGDVYQLNLTHRLRAKSSSQPRSLFSKIARQNQAPMMGYLEAANFQLLSISPERFVSINDGLIKTTPIKGTRSFDKDGSATAKLLADPKEKSELNMIVDLLRNDLGEVSETGSVKINGQRRVQTLTSLVHTYSEISGKLKTDISPIEALLAMFPGGSVTGCPKRRAMQIIDELEPVSRGPYCGSLVCIDPEGNLDSSILIRTIIKQSHDLYLPVGGGIVFDSDKQSEYQETLDKAKSIIAALNI